MEAETRRIHILARQLAAGAALDVSHPCATRQAYEELYARSVTDPAGFWADVAGDLVWKRKWVTHEPHCSWNLDPTQGPVHMEWFKGGVTNICYNALDAWCQEQPASTPSGSGRPSLAGWRSGVGGRGNMPCLICESNDEGPDSRRVLTYKQVLAEVCRVANWLRQDAGVAAGDTVTIYMPMGPEIVICMLACARIGAIHSVVFAGFSAEALAGRLSDAKSKVLLTSTGMMRGTKALGLKAIADEALRSNPQVGCVLVLEDPAVPASSCAWVAGRDVRWSQAIPRQSPWCEPAWVDAQHPLFMLYTSGSTGQPKGLLHATGGYMASAAAMMRLVFDLTPGAVHLCTADAGWITGHTALVYGPLLCGASVVVLGGPPTHPDPGRLWRVVERYKVSSFYTAPTAIRSLMQAGDEWLKGPAAPSRATLRVLGTAGEPIGEHAFNWYRDVIGEGHAPVMDTFWQTETGSVLLAMLPTPWAARAAPPGTAGLPFLGVNPVLIDAQGKEIQGPGEGLLALRGPLPPSMARTVFGDHDRYERTYFTPFPGLYLTGDGARRDEKGLWTITGRTDDVLNVSGHRIGTAEVEGALSSHPQVVEAAVIGVSHPVKGESVYAFVTLTQEAAGTQGGVGTPALRKALVDHIRKAIGPFAAPDVIHWAPVLPKTRSGKIMRRILRKVATGQEGELGDISTLADPGAVDVLIAMRGK